VQVEELVIPEVKLITPARHGDDRGFFSETWNSERFSEAGLSFSWVQDNHSLSKDKGVLRGLHFQTPPFAQDKLVRVTSGAIIDVAVDIRHGSPSFGRHVSAVISAENWRQILVPAGFAHGFCTLEPDTEVVYKVSALYSRENDKGLAWDDPDLGIDWALNGSPPLLSDKDKSHPKLADLPAYFQYSS